MTWKTSTKHELVVRLEAARNSSDAPLTSSSRNSFTSERTPHWLRIQARAGGGTRGNISVQRAQSCIRISYAMPLLGGTEKYEQIASSFAPTISAGQNLVRLPSILRKDEPNTLQSNQQVTRERRRVPPKNLPPWLFVLSDG